MPDSGDAGSPYESFHRIDPASPRLILEVNSSQDGSYKEINGGSSKSASKESQTEGVFGGLLTDEVADLYDDRIKALEASMATARVAHEQELGELKEETQALKHKLESDKKFFEEVIAEREAERESDQIIIADLSKRADNIVADHDKMLQRIRRLMQAAEETEVELKEARNQQSLTELRAANLTKDLQLKDELLMLREKAITDLESQFHQKSSEGRVMELQLTTLQTKLDNPAPSFSVGLRQSSNPSFPSAGSLSQLEDTRTLLGRRSSYRHSGENLLKKSLAEEVNECLLNRAGSSFASLHMDRHGGSGPGEATVGEQRSETEKCPDSSAEDGLTPSTSTYAMLGSQGPQSSLNKVSSSPTLTSKALPNNSGFSVADKPVRVGQSKMVVTDFTETISRNYQQNNYPHQGFRNDPLLQRRWKTDLTKPTVQLLPDVTAIALGVDVQGRMVKLIPRDSEAPTRNSHILTTTVDNQQFVRIKVFQGERELTRHNHQLTEFSLAIAAAPRQVPQVKVSLETTVKGSLMVTAEEETTASSLCLTLDGYQNWLDLPEVEKRRRDADYHAIADRNEATKIEARASLTYLINALLSKDASKRRSSSYNAALAAEEWLGHVRSPTIQQCREREQDIRTLLLHESKEPVWL